MDLAQHNASLCLILGEQSSSYALRRCLPTGVGYGRGDIAMAHAVGDWRPVPGAAAGANYARCMPFRYNGLRSETSAEVKQEVLAAMRHAYRAAKAANAPADAHWSYMPK